MTTLEIFLSICLMIAAVMQYFIVRRSEALEEALVILTLKLMQEKQNEKK